MGVAVHSPRIPALVGLAREMASPAFPTYTPCRRRIGHNLLVGVASVAPGERARGSRCLRASERSCGR